MATRSIKHFALAVVVSTAVGTGFVFSRAAAAAEGSAPAIQNSEWLIKNWQTEDGLPENSATAIVQTRDGYLWLSTFDGLVRFDGVHFTVFNPKNTPELPSSGIVNLHLDKKGRLWISTYGGLVLHEGTRWQVLTREEADQQEYVRSFTERDNGDMLLTKFNGKVVEFSDGRFTQLPPPPRNRPSRAYLGYVDELGRWWVVQNAFIGRWDGHAWVETIPVTTPVASIGCAKAKDGGLWLLQDLDLRKYSRGAEVSHIRLPERPGNCWSVAEDSQGNVWICSYDKGLCRVSPDGQEQLWNEENGLSYHNARCVYEDAENNLWIGTSGGGLMRFKPRRFQSFGVERGLSERVVRSVWPAPAGGLWIATYGQGLFRLRDGTVMHVPIPAQTNIVYCQSVMADKAGRTWVGTYTHGLWVSGTNEFEGIPFEKTGGHNIVALFEDSRGRIWLSGSKEVSVFDSGTFHSFSQEQGLSPSDVCCFGEDQNNIIWLSNIRGLFRLEGERFVEVHDSQNRSISGIDCIQSDADGCLWLGSVRDGLLRYRKGSFSRIEAGLPVSSIQGIIEDNDGFFWLTSNRGVMHARRRELEAAAEGRGGHLVCQLLDMSDGIPSVEFAGGGMQPTCAKDRDGRLWFATLKGVAMVDPAKFRSNPRPPPVAIEEVIYHTSSGPGAEQGKTERHAPSPFLGTLDLPAGSRNVEIHYTALSFTSPEKVHFQIRLQKSGAGWQDVGNRRVAYFDELQPGENVFQVRAANDDGVWNETGASLTFAVAPLFWQTAWFRGMMWVAVVGETILILALFRAMARRRRSRMELREQLDFEQLLSELSRVFINLPSEKIDDQIREALRRVGEYLKFDVASFSTFALDGKEGRTSVLWKRPGVREITCERMQDELPWAASELMHGRDVWLPRISNLPPEAEKDRATYLKYGLQSSYHVPLHVAGGVIASLSLCGVREGRERSRELLQRQRLIGEVFVNALTRKLGEERQRESEARFRIVADSAPVMIWMSGVDKLCTFFNKTWLDFTGRTLEQELGNGWAEGVHRADLKECLHSYNEAFDARKPFVLHYRLRKHDGEYRWILDNGTPRYDAHGNFAGYIGSCVDFTERKHAEEKFRLAIETSPNAILLVSERGLIVMANPKTEAMFGYTAEEMLGQPAELLVPERYRSHLAHRHTFQESPQNREMGRGRELFGRRKDGTEIEVEIALNPIHAQEQMLVLATIVDLTERRRTAAELQNLRQELAHFSRVSIIGQLASALAHELNQPLGAILRNAEAAELFLQSSKPDHEELRNILVDIRKDDQRAGEVIERLRLLLKRRDIEMQMLDAGKLVDDVLTLLRSDALGRRVAMELQAAPGLPMVRGDRVQLQQVLLNLIMNAMDAVVGCPPDRRQVRLQVRRESDNFVAFAVRDSGHGISPDQLSRIFEPFFTTKTEGMGLGLSISRTIVEAHGGRISAENKPEGGASFLFTVPVANGNGQNVKVQ